MVLARVLPVRYRPMRFIVLTATTRLQQASGRIHLRHVAEPKRRLSWPDWPWRLFAAEFAGVALLLLLGLSLVIVMFGSGSPIATIVEDEGVRRLVTGFLFGTIGTAIALSPIGNVSGAHVNPVVTMGFWIVGKLESRIAVGYVVAQLAGGIVGCLPLLAWGAMGRSVAFGASLPGPGYATQTVLAGEVMTTFGLLSVLCVFLAFRELRRFTPFTIPLLYSVMSYLEGAISGTSTNPARSLGPALLSGQWEGWWIYWLGPVAGALLALAVCSRLLARIQVAKLYHFDTDPEGVFRRRRLRRASAA
jgi:aquaporin Z